jgi:hypothetical protein
MVEPSVIHSVGGKYRALLCGRRKAFLVNFRALININIAIRFGSFILNILARDIRILIIDYVNGHLFFLKDYVKRIHCPPVFNRREIL